MEQMAQIDFATLRATHSFPNDQNKIDMSPQERVLIVPELSRYIASIFDPVSRRIASTTSTDMYKSYYPFDQETYTQENLEIRSMLINALRSKTKERLQILEQSLNGQYPSEEQLPNVFLYADLMQSFCCRGRIGPTVTNYLGKFLADYEPLYGRVLTDEEMIAVIKEYCTYCFGTEDQQSKIIFIRQLGRSCGNVDYRPEWCNSTLVQEFISRKHNTRSIPIFNLSEISCLSVLIDAKRFSLLGKLYEIIPSELQYELFNEDAWSIPYTIDSVNHLLSINGRQYAIQQNCWNPIFQLKSPTNATMYDIVLGTNVSDVDIAAVNGHLQLMEFFRNQGGTFNTAFVWLLFLVPEAEQSRFSCLRMSNTRPAVSDEVDNIIKTYFAQASRQEINRFMTMIIPADIFCFYLHYTSRMRSLIRSLRSSLRSLVGGNKEKSRKNKKKSVTKKRKNVPKIKNIAEG